MVIWHDTDEFKSWHSFLELTRWWPNVGNLRTAARWKVVVREIFAQCSHPRSCPVPFREGSSSGPCLRPTAKAPPVVSPCAAYGGKREALLSAHIYILIYIYIYIYIIIIIIYIYVFIHIRHVFVCVVTRIRRAKQTNNNQLQTNRLLELGKRSTDTILATRRWWPRQGHRTPKNKFYIL